ncbi:hypothetical protein GALL_341590 [mine drainage metagenome]|uniref:DUF3240 domain-containing protein n=1 Tax=mine drainage metagenome TaxID=410659 RepID=A0A1J5QW42_9ZZZZ
MDQCLLMIFAPPSVEETMVDWLLEHDEIEGFSSAEAYGHGVRKTGLSQLEQVTGRQRRVQFLICTSHEIAQHLVGDLRQRFTGVGLHYFVVPVTEAGRL